MELFITQYLLPKILTKLLFEFFFLPVDLLQSLSGKHCLKSAKYHQNGVNHECFCYSILTLSRSLLLTYELIFLRICCLRINSYVFFCTYSLISKKSTIVTPNILCCKIKPIVLIILSQENFKLRYLRITFYCFFIAF